MSAREPAETTALGSVDAAVVDERAPAAPDRHRGRLFRKYLLLILSLVSVALLASGGISLYFSYQDNQAALASLQHEKAVAAASRIEQFVARIAQQLVFAALPQLDAGDTELRRLEFLKLLRQMPEVTDIALLDAEGKELSAVSRLGMDVTGSGRDRSAEPAFHHAGRGQPWFGPVYFRKETEPYMTMSLRSGSGEKAPVTVAEVNLKFIWDVVSRITIGNKGKAYVVDAAGHLVADPDIGLVLRKTDLSGLAHVKAAADARGADESATVSRDLAGTAVLSSMAPIAALDWRVFVEQPVAEVYAKLDASILRTALLLVAGLAVSALAASALARSMVRPIRALQEGAARAAAGDLDQRIDVHTNDELESLAGEFNRMAAELKASYAGLERKVEQRTAELAQTLAEQTATAEVLQVISSSVADPQPVFDKILDSCERLFDTRQLGIYLLGDDGQLRVGSYRGTSRELVLKVYPRPLDGTVSGMAIREGRLITVADVQAWTEAPGYLRDIVDEVGNFAIALAPLLWEGRGIGAMTIVRQPPRPFTGKELDLLRTFSDQAVIAIQNARLFEQLEAKSHQLEVASRHKSEFLANMSHELRTPLNAIIGFSEVLAEQMFGAVNAKQLEYLQDIHSSGQHLLTLINDVLDLSKIEAGRMELELSTFDVHELLENALTLVRERAGRQGLQVTLDANAELGSWVADARKLKQVLLNLLTNAVKFTPAGGSVTLRARRFGESTLEIAVIDTGVGIAPEEQASVFDAFRQASGTYLRKAEGTGLGLALARRFVELHGGRLGLHSRPGQGSTFTFTLPARTLESS